MTSAATTVDAIPPARRARHGWRPLAQGVLWGIAVSTMEVVSLPVVGEGWSGTLLLALQIVPGWSAVGVGIALLVEFAGARIERRWLVIACAIACALAFSALWSWLYSRSAVRELSPAGSTMFPQGLDALASFAYQTWTVLFYGGFYFFAWRLNDRAERTRALLGEGEIARIRAETLLGEAQLQSLRGRVEPGLLLRVMTEVERRYAHPGTNADDLFARLVAFLRLAMPAVRSGESTLRGALALARAYTELLAELEPTRTQWTITGDECADVPFPALLLLPLLDAYATASPSPFTASVTVGAESAGVVIRFRGGPVGRAHWTSDELGYRVRVGLSTLYGNAWSMAQPADPAFFIMLGTPLPGVQASLPDAAGLPPPTTKGVSP